MLDDLKPSKVGHVAEKVVNQQGSLPLSMQPLLSLTNTDFSRHTSRTPLVANSVAHQI